MSRYLKIPIYLQWSGIEASQENVDIYIKKYSSLVVGAVIQSSWVLGVQEFIKDNFNNFDFYIISATPEDEMNLIATEIGISSFFQGIYGSPAKKNELISRVIELNKINPKDAVFIGDTSSDLEAAISSNIKFILICNECNRNFQDNYKGEKINNFL